MQTLRRLAGVFLTAGILLWPSADARAQEPAPPEPVQPATEEHTALQSASQNFVLPRTHDLLSDGSSRDGLWGHATDFLEDQKQIWTSPFRIRPADAVWLVPAAGIAAGLFVTDRQYSASLPQNPVTLRHYKDVSDLGLASLVGASAGIYVLSFPTHNEHWRETGFLATEAAVNSLVTAEALKFSFGRERPYQGDGSGSFFRGGTSFPSEHAAVAWSIAGVLSHEYDGTLPRLFAYGAASAISFARIHEREHFPSDVFVGGLLGYLVSQSVYSHRHDPELGGSAWESPRDLVTEPSIRTPSFQGSPYVSLDSWIYPAIERLAALGYVKTATLGLRPWTRLECARLLSEASEGIDSDAPWQVQELYSSLWREFPSELDETEGGENVHAQVESVYSRALDISGKPLTDNYHFGQTLLNDYGRPFEQGFNSIVGSSGWITAGPFVIYARGEYQSAPSAPSPSPAALNFIATADVLPPNPPAMPVAAVSRFRLLDAYVGMNLAGWQLSFGEQSLWWGPGDEGAMIFTNNAQPLNKMFSINRVSPIQLPRVLGFSTAIRMQFFLGQVSGQQFINNAEGGVLNSNLIGQYGQTLALQPFLSGGRLSLRFTPNLEIGISKTTLYGGEGNPFTLKTFIQSTLAHHVNGHSLGHGESELDLTYRIPRLRDWLTFYVDAMQTDEISPADRPYKAAFESGLYLPKIPNIPKLDLRIEGGTTSPINFPTCNGCYYNDNQYLNGETNNGVLMGTWLGRASQGEAAQSTYWLSATKKIGIEIRHRKVDRQFVPQGGTQNDIALNTDFFLKSGVQLTGKLQYESWQIPLLAMGPQSNVAAELQVSFWPHWHTR